MEHPLIFARAATVPLEIAHHGIDGRLHGHSLTVEAWTAHDVDLDVWRARLERVVAAIEGPIERTIGGRTFEDIAAAVLHGLPEADRAVISLPTRGHRVEARRG